MLTLKLPSEKYTLQDTVTKLQTTLNQLRSKENDTTDKVKRSLDAVEQAQYEKSSAELEVRRLKDELERQHSRLRDAIAEQVKVSQTISDFLIYVFSRLLRILALFQKFFKTSLTLQMPMFLFGTRYYIF